MGFDFESEDLRDLADKAMNAPGPDMSWIEARGPARSERQQADRPRASDQSDLQPEQPEQPGRRAESPERQASRQSGGSGEGGGSSIPVTGAAPGAASASPQPQSSVSTSAQSRGEQDSGDSHDRYDHHDRPVEGDMQSEDPGASSLDHTDQQDQIQQSASVGGMSGDDGTAGATGGSPDPLPTSPGFRQKNVDAGQRMRVKYLPSGLQTRLKQILREAAEHRPDVSASQADRFVTDLGQTALVVAYLSAQLDVPMQVDEATSAAIELFRAANPRLTRIADRLDQVERNLADQTTAIRLAREDQQRTDGVAGSIEMIVSWLLADKVNSFTGPNLVSSLGEVKLGDHHVLDARQKARRAAQDQHAADRQREGRPMR